MAALMANNIVFTTTNRYVNKYNFNLKYLYYIPWVFYKKEDAQPASRNNGYFYTSLYSTTFFESTPRLPLTSRENNDETINGHTQLLLIRIAYRHTRAYIVVLYHSSWWAMLKRLYN